MGYLAAVLSFLKPIIGPLKTGGSIVAGVFKTIGTTLVNTGKWMVVTLVGLLAALIAGFRVAVTQTQKLAKEIQDISNRTGMSFSQSMSAKFGFGALGINANQLFGDQGNLPMFLKMRGAAFGYADPSNPANMAQNAMQFQKMAAGGEINRLIALNQLKGVYGGNIPEGMLQLMNMSPDKIQEQQQWQSRMQSSMGLNPDAIQKYAQELPLVQMRIGAIIELIKTKLAGEGLPIVERLLTVFANFLSKHASGLADFLVGIMRFLWVQLPDMMLKGANIGVTAIGFIIKVLFSLGQTAVGILSALEQGNSGLNEWIYGILRAFDAVINAGINFANFIQNLGTIFHNASTWVYNAMNSILGFFADLSPVSQAILQTMPGLGNFVTTAKYLKSQGYDFSDRMEYREWKPLNLNSNMSGYYRDKIQPAIADAKYSEKLQGFLDSHKGAADDIMKSMSGYLEEISKGLGTKGDRERGLSGLLDATKENTDAVKGVRDAIVGHGQNLLANFSAQDMMARIAAYLAEDNWLTISRA